MPPRTRKSIDAPDTLAGQTPYRRMGHSFRHEVSATSDCYVSPCSPIRSRTGALRSPRLPAASKTAAPAVTMPTDSKMDPTASSGVCHSAPTTASDISRAQATPSTSVAAARPPPEYGAERQPHSERCRADSRDIPRGKGELAIVGPLNQRLEDVIVNDQSSCGERSVNSDSKKYSPGQPEGKADDEDGHNGRDGEEFGEIGPGSPGRRRPEPIESRVLESVRRAAMRHGQGQNRGCEQARQRRDPKPGPWH